MKRKKIYKNNNKWYITTYPDGSYVGFNVTQYCKVRKVDYMKEYTVQDLQHKMFERVVAKYNSSPWLNIKKFSMGNNICTVKGLVFVYDGGGYVLKLKYETNGNEYYRYVENINSLKYLKLLKLKDIKVLEK